MSKPHDARWVDNAINGGRPVPLNAPSGSWWAGVDRENWKAAVESHSMRMQNSRFGIAADPRNVPKEK
jgi:hypothetical protein